VVSNLNQLSLAEELILILLDDSSGKLFDSAKPYALDIAIAASLIMELTLNGRIDTDSQALFVISSEPTGNPVLDEMLAEINAAQKTLSTSIWLKRFANKGEMLVELIVKGLLNRGILKSVEKRLLWVFKTRVYPPTSGIEEREVRARVMQLLNNDEIPHPRDALIIGLLRSTGLISHLLNYTESKKIKTRIDQIANLEEINRSLNIAVQEAWEENINRVPLIF